MKAFTMRGLALAACAMLLTSCSDGGALEVATSGSSAPAGDIKDIAKGNGPQGAPPPSVYGLIGTIQPRSAAQLRAAGLNSPFSIGAETTDRNFSTYSNWDQYLGPLGIPAARVQTGWADVEPVRGGDYQWAKLDEIVTGMRAQGVQPWLNLGYGNRLYSGGGTEGLGGGIPVAGSEGRAAWLDFVRATVARYNDPSRRVTEWEIWNEPEGNVNNTAAAYATFAAETARAIKSVQPDAKILVGAFLNPFNNFTFAETVVNNFAAEKGATVPNADVTVTYHAYQENPDRTYLSSRFAPFRSLVESKGFRIRQGENGAPSTNQPEFALGNLPWTEESQAKYALRRLLGDFYRGIPSSLFTITDLHYDNAKNTKGLLRTGVWNTDLPNNGDQTVTGEKTAYRTVRNLTAVFDNRLQVVAAPGCTGPTGYTIHAYTRLDAGNVRRNMLVVWRNTDRPGLNGAEADITITCTAFNFPRFKSVSTLRPRYADLLTGNVYQLLDAGTVVQPNANGVTITGLRVYDSPVVLADQGIVLF